MPFDTNTAPLLEIEPGEFLTDPYTGFARMRAQSRVGYLQVFDMWWVAGYEECVDGLGRPEEFSSKNLKHIHFMDGDSVLSLAGDDHKRIRKGLVSNLKASAVHEHVTRFIGPAVSHRVDALAARETVDMVADFWEPLAVTVFRELLGIPDISEDQLRSWFQRLSAGSANFLQIPEVAQAARDASDEVTEALLTRIDRLPATSLVSHLYRRAVGETPEEKARDILPTIKVIIGAAEQEPGHAGSTVLAGILSSGFAARIVENPEASVDLAIEEGLRWVSPVQGVARYTTRETVLAGVTIPAEQWVMFSLASANRDEHIWGDDADEFRPGREAKHLGFSAGPHTCAGAQFGKAVMRTALLALFERYPRTRLAEPAEPIEFEGFGFRAPARLHVHLHGEAR